jgi:hypothetical protein
MPHAARSLRLQAIVVGNVACAGVVVAIERPATPINPVAGTTTELRLIVMAVTAATVI